MSKMFVCDEKNEVFSKWFNETHKEAMKVKDSKMDFLKKQAKAIEKEWANHWDILFEDLKQAGVIDRSKDRDDYIMEMTKNPVQFFIQKKSEVDSGLPGFLKALIGGSLSESED